MGEVTKKFEEEFAKFTEVKNAIAVTNCTAALHLALKGLGIGHGDEVIVPSLTFVATANAVIYVGARPVFADITSLDNWDISPEDIVKKITSKTKAIIVMHYGGYPCDMNSINSIAEKHNLFVIEDAAHAPGAEYLPHGIYFKRKEIEDDSNIQPIPRGSPRGTVVEDNISQGESVGINSSDKNNNINKEAIPQGRGKKCGSLGDVACFSFFSSKNMTTGEGGMITTNDDVLANKIMLMRSHGMTSGTLDRHKGHAFSYDVTELGHNYRIDEIRSALGIVQLNKLEENNKKREVLTRQYRDKLADVSWLNFPFKDQYYKPAYHLFPTLLSPEVKRQDFMEYLRSKGIQTSIHYPPIHLFSFYRQKFSTKEGDLPLTETVSRREVTFPMSPLLIKSEIDYITEIVKFF